MGDLAFSYIRLSSDRQLRGDSLRRQLERSEEYAAAHGLTLDTDLQDLGVSAFTGANRETGALGRFFQMVTEGRIPEHSWLLVESLDRLSRDHVDIALESFLRIIRSGIRVVTLTDMQVYSRESLRENWTQLIISLAIMSRAREESAMKADRLRRTWVAKRRRTDTKLTAKCPSWLRLSKDRKSFEIVPEHAETVRRIFEDLASGIGRGGIARRLNAAGVRTFAHGRHWHQGTVSKICSNDAVIGVYHPNTTTVIEVDGVRRLRRKPDGEPICDYYPRIIPDELWIRAQASSRSRQLGQPMNPAGRGGSKMNTLFSRFARCADCGNPFTYRDQGPRGRAVLRCSGSMVAKCDNHVRVHYAPFEKAILDFVEEADLADHLPDETAHVRRDLAAKEVERDQLTTSIGHLLDTVERDGSKSARARLAEREQVLQEVIRAIAALKIQIQSASVQRTPQDRRAMIADLRRSMITGDAFLIRNKIAQALREVIDVLRIERDGTIYVLIAGGLVGYIFNADLTMREKVDLRPLVHDGRLHLEQFRARAATLRKVLPKTSAQSGTSAT